MPRLVDAGADVLAATPDPPGRGPRGLRRATVRLDLTSPRTWPGPLEGTDRVYLVCPTGLVDVRRFVRPFLERVATGPAHVVFQSVAGVQPGMPHWQVEVDLDVCGIPHTVLRPTTFHQRLVDTYGADLAASDRLRMPAGRGRTAFVDARDVAEVAAAMLVSADPPRATYTLTGSDFLSGAEIAALLSRVLGREIRFESISMARYRRELLDTGMDLSSVRVRLLLNASARLVLGGATNPTLRDLLGRPPTTLEAYVEEHRTRWTTVR